MSEAGAEAVGVTADFADAAACVALPARRYRAPILGGGPGGLPAVNCRTCRCRRAKTPVAISFNPAIQKAIPRSHLTFARTLQRYDSRSGSRRGGLTWRAAAGCHDDATTQIEPADNKWGIARSADSHFRPSARAFVLVNSRVRGAGRAGPGARQLPAPARARPLAFTASAALPAGAQTSGSRRWPMAEGWSIINSGVAEAGVSGSVHHSVVGSNPRWPTCGYRHQVVPGCEPARGGFTARVCRALDRGDQRDAPCVAAGKRCTKLEPRSPEASCHGVHPRGR